MACRKVTHLPVNTSATSEGRYINLNLRQEANRLQDGRISSKYKHHPLGSAKEMRKRDDDIVFREKKRGVDEPGIRRKRTLIKTIAALPSEDINYCFWRSLHKVHDVASKAGLSEFCDIVADARGSLTMDFDHAEGSWW
ncbi:unnamed protein product, partial [Nesidiocoris tenuis]